MKLAHILKAHADTMTTPLGLNNNLGDGFLMQNNSVYSRIRQKASDFGYSYTDKVDASYIAFPMGQLEKILKNKSIPYLNNTDPLIKINEQAHLDWNHVVDNLRPNYIFHESCHAIARELRPLVTSQTQKITVMLIEESFANTCEFLAIADAQDSLHRLFLEVNSYFTVFEDRTNLRKSIEKHGKASIFKFMLIGYLHSNFLNENINDLDFKKIISLCDFKTAVDNKSLKALSHNVFALNPRFRYATTEMYLRLEGITMPINQALKFDYLKILTDDKMISQFIDQLALVMEPTDV